MAVFSVVLLPVLPNAVYRTSLYMCLVLHLLETPSHRVYHHQYPLRGIVDCWTTRSYSCWAVSLARRACIGTRLGTRVFSIRASWVRRLSGRHRLRESTGCAREGQSRTRGEEEVGRLSWASLGCIALSECLVRDCIW